MPSEICHIHPGWGYTTFSKAASLQTFVVLVPVVQVRGFLHFWLSLA